MLVKKRLISFMLVIALLSSTVIATAAMYASNYLDSYGGALVADGNGVMTLSYSVRGTRRMDVVGAQEIKVEEKIGSRWFTYATFSEADYPEFYAYGASSKVADFSFDGVPGVTYRVILTAYAELNGGSDTGTVTISQATCE